MMNQNKNARLTLFSDVNFKWLLRGAVLSMLGDQLTLIALPWLVLKMTGDPFVLGTVLALIGVPRALFMLIGGALVDRYSPKRVLMLTKYVNALLLGVLALLVLTNGITVWIVYALALAIGLASAFSIPSGSALLPQVVNPEQLQHANGVMLGLRQLAMFAGPLLAGLLIALFSAKQVSGTADFLGLGIAFLLDAISFVLSAWTLSKVRIRWTPPAVTATAQTHLLRAVADGIRYCWDDVAMRTCFLYWAAIALLISGPLQVAMPILAAGLDHGAATFGILMGAHGAGTLAGMAVAGMKRDRRLMSLGMTILLVDALIGILIAPIGMINATWHGAALLLLIGILGGFIQVAIFTWMQQRVPPSMMGRTMSLFMFIFMGIAPVSAAFTGWMMRTVSVAHIFAGSGALLIVIVSVALVASPMRSVKDSPASPPAR